MSLRQIGFSLEEIRNCLDKTGYTPLEVVRRHIVCLHETLERQHALAEKLEVLAEHLSAQADVPAAEFLQVVQAMTEIERYLPFDRCSALFSDVFAELRLGTDPSDPRAQELARRFAEVMAGASGLDSDFPTTLRKLCENESDVTGIDVEPMQRALEFLRRASSAAGIEQPV